MVRMLRPMNDSPRLRAVSLHFDIACPFEVHPGDLGDNDTRAGLRGTERRRSIYELDIPGSQPRSSCRCPLTFAQGSCPSQRILLERLSIVS